MGLLLFTTCFPLYIFGSAKTELTSSAGFPIFLSIVNWWSGSPTLSLLIVFLCYLKKVWFSQGSCDPPLVEHGKFSGKKKVDDDSWVGTVSCAKGFALVKFSYLMSICSDYLSEKILWRWATRKWSVTQEGRVFLCLCWCIAHLVMHLCFCIFVASYLYFVCLCNCICAFVYSYFRIFVFVYPRRKCCGQVELFKSPSVCWR